jgi:hypothetical protein
MKRLVIAGLVALAAASAPCAFALSNADHIGGPASPQAGWRTVRILPDTRHVNINWGETVHLEFDGKATTWSFTGVDTVIKLRRIIPGAPDVEIYVARPARH